NALLVMLSPDDESDVDGPSEVVSVLDCAPESLPLLLHAPHASATTMSALLHARVNVIIRERIDRDRPAQRPVSVDVEPEAGEIWDALIHRGAGARRDRAHVAVVAHDREHPRADVCQRVHERDVEPREQRRIALAGGRVLELAMTPPLSQA